MQLTITDVQNHSTKKDGTPITDNKGRPKFRSVIKTLEKGNTFLSGFVYKPLNVGDVIDATVTTEQYNGMTQYKFSINRNMKEEIKHTESTNATMAELKTQTALLRQISENTEKIAMALSTAKTIEEIKSAQEPEEVDFGDVLPEEDFEPEL